MCELQKNIKLKKLLVVLEIETIIIIYETWA